MAVAEELLKIAVQTAVQHFAAPQWPRRLGGAIGLLLVAAVAGLAALGTAVAALGLWVAPKIGPPLACIVCMGALLLVSLVLSLTARALVRRRRRPKNAENNLAALAYLLEAAGRDVRAAFERHIPSLIIAALVGGIVTGIRARGKRRG